MPALPWKAGIAALTARHARLTRQPIPMTSPFSLTLPALLLCALLALLLHAVPAPAGGGVDTLGALAGMALGLGLLLPMYVLRALGAGDVKLMAMVGAFVGPQQVLSATLLTLLAGGVLAALVAASQGVLRQTLLNSYCMLLHSVMRGMGGGNARLDAPPAATGKLPYAIAIAAGNIFSFFWSVA